MESNQNEAELDDFKHLNISLSVLILIYACLFFFFVLMGANRATQFTLYDARTNMIMH